MRLVIGSDHAGFAVKQEMIAHLRATGHKVTDVGSFDPAPVDFPDIARDLVDICLAAEFSTDADFRRRVAKLAVMEAS